MSLQTGPSAGSQVLPPELEAAASADQEGGDDSGSAFDEILDQMPDIPDDPSGDKATPSGTEPTEPTSDDQQNLELNEDGTPREPEVAEEGKETPEGEETEGEKSPTTGFEAVEDLDAVDLSTWGLDESIAPRVQSLLDHARTVQANAASTISNTEDRVGAYRDQYKAAETEMREVIEALKEGGPEAKAVLDSMQLKDQTIHELNQHVASITWAAFNERYPNYKSLPPQTQIEFAGIMQSNRYLEMGGDESNLLEKVEEALSYAAYRTKADLAVARRQAAAAATPADSPSAKAQPTPAKAQAKKQAVLGETTLPPHQPVMDPSSVSYDQLMDKNDHLL